MLHIQLFQLSDFHGFQYSLPQPFQRYVPLIPYAIGVCDFAKEFSTPFTRLHTYFVFMVYVF